MARPWVPLALAFFVIGVVVAYVILPFASTFLLSFSSADLQPLITASEYFGFVTTLFLVFGLVMEYPIVLVLLSKVGILTERPPAQLAPRRDPRHRDHQRRRDAGRRPDQPDRARASPCTCSTSSRSS